MLIKKTFSGGNKNKKTLTALASAGAAEEAGTGAFDEVRVSEDGVSATGAESDSKKEEAIQ